MPPSAPVDESGRGTGSAGDAVGPRVWLPPHPRWLRVGGLRTSYVDVGDGPVVVLVHGLGHSTHAWRKNLAPLAQAGYRVMAIDLPGFGYSDAPEEYTLDRYVAFLRGWLELHCVEQASLVGNSLGGLIVAATAAADPQRVNAAVLVDPAGFSRPLHWALRFAAALAPSRLLIRRVPTQRQIRQALRFVYHDPSLIEDDEVARIAELSARQGVRESMRLVGHRAVGLIGMRRGMGLGQVPAEITVPTLVLWGRYDRVVPISHAQSVLAVARDAEYTVFENSGHCPMMEEPDAFNARLLEFLRTRVPPG